MNLRSSFQRVNLDREAGKCLCPELSEEERSRGDGEGNRMENNNNSKVNRKSDCVDYQA